MNNQLRVLRVLRPQFFRSLPIDAIAALIGSIICLSFSPIFIRLSEQEIGPNATAFNRFWIAAAALGLLNILMGSPEQKTIQPQQPQPSRVDQAKLLIADGVLLSVGLIFWAWSLTQTSVANSSLTHNLVPLFTILGGWLAFGKTFDRRFLLGMAIAFTGVILLEVNHFFSFEIGSQLLGDLAALLSAVLFGIHPLIVEKLRNHLNSITILTWSSTSSVLLLLPVTLITEKQLFPTSVNGWLAVMGLAVFGQLLGVGLWTYCLKKISSGFASLTVLVIPALSAVEGWAIFSEKIELWTWISFIVILWGMYLAISSKSAIKSKTESSDQLSLTMFENEPPIGEVKLSS